MKSIYVKFLLAIFLQLLCWPIYGQSILGIDVSHWQGTISWSQVYASGKMFSYAKATEGNGYTDANFVTYMNEGSAAGLVMGAYHFARPDLNADAVVEANYFVSIASDYIGIAYLPPVLDLERQGDLNWSQLASWAEIWMATVENSTGIRPLIYINKTYASNLNGNVNDFGLWLADYNGGAAPPVNTYGWGDWLFKQYTSSGTVSGISGSVDLNVFNGTAAAFNDLIYSVHPPNLYAPSNNAETVSVPINFDWSTVSGVSDYRICVSTSPNGFDPTATPMFPNSVLNATTGTNSHYNNWSEAEEDTVYYWAVRADVPGSESVVSPVYSFTAGCLVPPPVDSIWGDTVLCSGTSAQYSILPVAEANSYTWIYSGEGDLNANGLTCILSPSTSGILSVVANNSCGSSAAKSRSIAVHPIPVTPIITHSSNVLESNSAQGNQWYNQDGLISGANNQSYTASTDGDYYVIVTLSSCSSLPSNTISITGIETQESARFVKVYPNPVSNEVIIEIEGYADKVNFEIFNLVGQLVFKGDFVERISVSTSDFSPGVYLIKWGNDKTFGYKKIIKGM